MKVQVNLTVKANAEENSTFPLIVGAADTVSNVKERVMALQLLPFAENDLKLAGEVLEDGKRLSDCGVKEGSSLDFEVKAAESSLVRQLTELLQARDLSSDELGLLYCYKHGVNISQSLRFVGHEGKLADFVKKQKVFSLENGCVSLNRDDTSLKPFSLSDEVANILKSESGVMDIKDLKSKFTDKFNVGLASIAGMKPMEFIAKHKEVFSVNGRFVSLKGVNSDQKYGEICPKLPSSTKPRVSFAPPGLEEIVTIDDKPAESQRYQDLHDKIYGSVASRSKWVRALNDAVEFISNVSFLNIDHVVKGGSVSKDTSISGAADAEAVFFLKGLPLTGHGRWLPSLLKAVAGVLAVNQGEEQVVGDIHIGEDVLELNVGLPVVKVKVKFTPVFQSFAHTIQILKESELNARRHYISSLAKERIQFIAKQPSTVKVTMRLMKWWRDQQRWTTKLNAPSDDIIELLVVYSAVQSKPADQHAAVSNVMSLLSRFNDLRVVWSNYYSKDDVWAPLLRQRPLLMDPTNPFVNIADPELFEAGELVQFASTTHFFW